MFFASRKKTAAIAGAFLMVAGATTVVTMQSASAYSCSNTTTDDTNYNSTWRPVSTTAEFVVPAEGCHDIQVKLLNRADDDVNANTTLQVRVREINQDTNWRTTYEGCFYSVKANGGWVILHNGADKSYGTAGGTRPVNDTSRGCFDSGDGTPKGNRLESDCRDIEQTTTKMAAPKALSPGDDPVDEIATGTRFRVEVKNVTTASGACDPVNAYLQIKY